MSTIKSSTTTTTAYQVVADTTGALVIQTGATPTTAITVGTDQSVTLAGALAVQSQNITPYTGFKNRIINGAMVIDQRNAGASVTPADGGFDVDRWRFQVSQASKLSAQQNAGSVTPPTGFKNYLGITSLSAYSSLSTDYFWVAQFIEGFNTADLGFGSSSASTVTLSFWVRSSLTGTFSGALVNSDSNRSYPFSYTISSANTWEQKSVSIAGDQSGTWVGATNGNGLGVYFNLGTGSNRQGTANAWAAADYRGGVTGSVSVVGTNGATFYVTGVQLEKGLTATSFDYRPYGTELQLCQRYFQTLQYVNAAAIAIGACGSTSQAEATTPLLQTMRAAPTITLPTVGTSAGNIIFLNSSQGFPSTIGTITTSFGVSTNTITFNGTGFTAAFVLGGASILYSVNNSTIQASAEL
jgi:hypothetical protein